MAILIGIQCSLQISDNNAGLKKLEQKIQHVLSDILKIEELKWLQRSRSKWLAYGDQNIRHYHMKAIYRRRKNKIVMLKNDQIVLIKDGRV